MTAGTVADAVAALRRGEVVVIPTDTVYGLAAIPGGEDRIFALKRRPKDVPIPVLVADVAQAAAVGRHHPLMDELWPGAATLVVERVDGAGTVGLRCPDHDLVRALCREVGPLAVTSANLHGEDTPPTADGVAALFPDNVVVDGGRCEGEPSTVLDVTGAGPVVLRAGRLPWPPPSA